MAVFAGLVAAGLWMMIASAGLPEGEGISDATGLFALGFGFVVMIAAGYVMQKKDE